MDLAPAICFLALTVLPSLIVTWAAAFVVRRCAAAWGLIDKPGERKVHVRPTPMGGGLAIAAGVIASFAVGQVLLLYWMSTGRLFFAPEFVAPHLPGLMQQSPHLWILLAAATAMMILGLIDDRRGLDWRIRLAVQAAVAAAVVCCQDWQATFFIGFPVLTGGLSVLWIVGLVNSFNMLDNMDGLSAGVAAIVAAMLAAVVLISPDLETTGPQWFVGGFLLVLLGAMLGFLWHNRPPARLFMGDAGSYFVGFCIAAATLLATFAGYHNQSQYTILAPLCVLAVPLYDTVTVLWIRLREGRSPFQGDTCHISHRLVELGLSKGQAVLTIYLMTATCGLGALLLPRVDATGAGVIMLMVGCVLALIAVFEATARTRIRRAGTPGAEGDEDSGSDFEGSNKNKGNPDAARKR